MSRPVYNLGDRMPVGQRAVAANLAQQVQQNAAALTSGRASWETLLKAQTGGWNFFDSTELIFRDASTGWVPIYDAVGYAGTFWLDPADVRDDTNVEVRLRGVAVSGAVAPGNIGTARLRRISGTIGGVVQSPTTIAQVSTPTQGVDGLYKMESAASLAATAGLYVLTVQYSQAHAASSYTNWTIDVQVRSAPVTV